jgi:hypothetical protein
MAVLDDRAVDLECEVAELRRRLAERDAELADALAREAATSEVLQVINSSPADLAPVFEAMLEKAMRLCEAAFGALMSFDGALFHRVAQRGFPSELVEEHEPLPPLPGGALVRIVSGERIVRSTILLKPSSIAPGTAVLEGWSTRAVPGPRPGSRSGRITRCSALWSSIGKKFDRSPGTSLRCCGASPTRQ